LQISLEPTHVKFLSGTLLGRLLALPPNIRLGKKGLPGTNTPAYYENSSVTDKKDL